MTKMTSERAFRLYLYSTALLIIVLVGGRAFIYGVVPGAYFVAILEEIMRGFGPIHYWLFPLALILAIVVLPSGEGLFGLYHRRHHRDYFPKFRVRRE